MNKVNYLDRIQYIISEDLHRSLQDETLNDTNTIYKYDAKGFYLVCMRKLNISDKSIIYSYIHYNDIFSYTLAWYLKSRNEFHTTMQKDLGRYMLLLDSNFEKSLSSHWMPRQHNPIPEGPSVINNLLARNNTTIDDIYFIMTKLNHIGNLTDLANVVSFGFEKRVLRILELLFKEHPNFARLWETWVADKIDLDILVEDCFNIFDSTVFVVKDLEGFEESIRSLGYNLNKGPRTYRGYVDSMKSYLSILDLDYRTALSNHNKHHCYIGSINNNSLIPSSKFSFNNIHNNLGNTRWYSTKSNFKLKSHLHTNIRSFSVKTKLYSRQDLLLRNYILIRDIMERHNNIASKELQLEIENTLYEQEVNLSNESILKNRLNFSEQTYNLIVNKRIELINFLTKVNFDKDNKIFRYNKEYKHWVPKIVGRLGLERISDMLLQFFMSVVSIEYIRNKDTDLETPGIPTLTAFERFGKNLIEKYIFTEYLNYKEENKVDISISHYKSIFEDKYSELKAENLYATFGGYFVHCLDIIGLLTNEIDKNYLDEDTKTMSYARVTPQARAVLINEKFKSFHLPNKLPMIYPPKDFLYNPEDPSNNMLGGYLLNDVNYTFEIFKDKIGYTKKTTLEKENLIVNWVNGTSKTPFKVNKETLNFLYEHGVNKGIIINEDNKELMSYKKNPYKIGNSTSRKKFRSLISKIDMQKNILSIADLYSNFDAIYFPVRLDNRTRMYCDTDYFDFQKNDLSKGLILFSKPGVIYKWDKDVIEYFKAYGANMYGDGLDKKSIEQRIKWIDDNSERILDFESNDIINKAENKTCFVSFCFEYRRFIDFINNPNTVKHLTNLPIQLDASCNVFQHITLLTNESKMYSILNLDKSTKKDKPGDYYTHIIENTGLYIKKEISRLEQIESKSKDETKLLNNYLVLSKVVFKRSALKKTIMTLPYNASIPTLTENVAKELIQISEGKHALYMADGSDIKLNKSQIITLIQAQKRVIEIESPKLKELNRYLGGIVDICTKLNTPIPWRLPHGANINQSYVTKKRTVIKPFTFIEKKFTFIKYDKTKFSLTKQKNAIIPNLIHSLDATTIGLMYEDMSKKGGIYTVHDCFAVTADNIPYLLWKIKSTYLKLYSDSSYLRGFDNMVKLTINNVFGDEVYTLGENKVNIKKAKSTLEFPFPDVNEVLKHDNRDDIKRLMDAAYIIK